MLIVIFDAGNSFGVGDECFEAIRNAAQLPEGFSVLSNLEHSGALGRGDDKSTLRKRMIITAPVAAVIVPQRIEI
jgi:hypothetical protein